MATDTEVTSPDRSKVLGSTVEALGSRQCSPATATLLHRSRINTELSPKTAEPYKGFGGRNQGPTETKTPSQSTGAELGNLTQIDTGLKRTDITNTRRL